jgi:hypothetical protein
MIKIDLNSAVGTVQSERSVTRANLIDPRTTGIGVNISSELWFLATNILKQTLVVTGMVRNRKLGHSGLRRASQ